jgi:hypothetical protein
LFFSLMNVVVLLPLTLQRSLAALQVLVPLRSLKPTKHSQRPERIPPTRFAHRFTEVQRERLVVRVVEKPSSIRLACALDNLQRVEDARIRVRTGVSEVIERAEYVVVISGWKCEFQEFGICHLTGRAPPEQSTLEQVFLPSPSGRCYFG